jgi:hypothetical protein
MAMIKARPLTYYRLPGIASAVRALEARSNEKSETTFAGAAWLHEANGALVFRTAPFTHASGSERCLCSTLKLDRPLKVRVIEFADQADEGVTKVTPLRLEVADAINTTQQCAR